MSTRASRLSIPEHALSCLESAAERSWRAGRLDRAERFVRRVLWFHPSRASSLTLLGEIQLARGEELAAFESFREAVQIGGPNARLACRAGEALAGADEPKRAAEWFERAVQLAGPDAGRIRRRARLLLERL